MPSHYIYVYTHTHLHYIYVYINTLWRKMEKQFFSLLMNSFPLFTSTLPLYNAFFFASIKYF